jgi:hypothetical protein
MPIRAAPQELEISSFSPIFPLFLPSFSPFSPLFLPCFLAFPIVIFSPEFPSWTNSRICLIL